MKIVEIEMRRNNRVFCVGGGGGGGEGCKHRLFIYMSILCQYVNGDRYL